MQETREFARFRRLENHVDAHRVQRGPESIATRTILRAFDHERGVMMGGSDPRKDGCALGVESLSG